MKKYVITTKEAAEIDRKTCETKNITNLDLIKKAGRELKEAFLHCCKPGSDELISIFSGSGHNGADALMLGSLFLSQGYNVTFVIVSSKEHLKPENLLLASEIENAGGIIQYLHEDSDFDAILKIIEKSSYVIDGIFGTGLNKEISGFLSKVIEAITDAKFVFSIDIPSGISGDTGLVMGSAVKADMTAIVEYLKAGNLLNQAADYHGKKVTVKIGLLEADTGKYHLTEENIIRIPKRKNYSHKYHYGSLLIIGGSPEMTGAPMLASYAALRSGAGLATVALPKRALPYLKLFYPEIIVRYYADFSELFPLLEKKKAIAFGTGLGRENPDAEAILEELLERDIPTVVDADGIYYLKRFLKEGSKYPHVIITPHLGELSVLTGIQTEELAKRSLDVVQDLAQKFDITIVLKGPCTLIADKNEIWFSDYGNPGLATAGSGDVLTGVITSLLGQGFPVLEAAKSGVFLHSLAGFLAKEKYGEAGLIASDIINYLPEAIKKISCGEEDLF